MGNDDKTFDGIPNGISPALAGAFPLSVLQLSVCSLSHECQTAAWHPRHRYIVAISRISTRIVRERTMTGNTEFLLCRNSLGRFIFSGNIQTPPIAFWLGANPNHCIARLVLTWCIMWYINMTWVRNYMARRNKFHVGIWGNNAYTNDYTFSVAVCSKVRCLKNVNSCSHKWLWIK